MVVGLPVTPALPAVSDPALERFARLVRRQLGVPTALVTLVSADEQVFPGALGLPEPWQTTRRTPLTHSFCQHVVLAAEPLVIEDARLDPLVQDNLAIVDLQVVAYAGWPLTAADGSVVGSLCAIDSVPRQWGEEDLAVLADLAGACSSQLQLLASQEAAGQAAVLADAANQRLAVLAQASNDLADAEGRDDLDRVIKQLPGLLVPTLADGCVISLRGEDGRFSDHAWWHHEEVRGTVLSQWVGLRHQVMPAHSPLRQVLDTGRPQSTDSRTVAAMLPAGPARELLEQLGDTRWFHAPIRGRNTMLGVLTVFSSQARPSLAEEEVTVRGIAGRVGLAMDNQRLAHDQEQLTERLQRSLLTDPPQPDHGEIVVRYQPAAESAKVGGDWYDAFIQPGGTTMIAIGDVAGHDSVAAATMGQLRGLVRGIAAFSDARPARVLQGVDHAKDILMIDGLATLALARFEQTPHEVEEGTTRMVFSNAGHPPPLVLHPDGTAEFLTPDGKAEMLVGAQVEVVRTDRTVVLEREATVLLYTDGLVERRDSDLDAGQQRLLDLALQLTAGTLEELCEGILDGMGTAEYDDDIALVAVRLHPQDRPRPAEAGPNVVPDSAPEPAHPAQ